MSLNEWAYFTLWQWSLSRFTLPQEVESRNSEAENSKSNKREGEEISAMCLVITQAYS